MVRTGEIAIVSEILTGSCAGLVRQWRVGGPVIAAVAIGCVAQRCRFVPSFSIAVCGSVIVPGLVRQSKSVPGQVTQSSWSASRVTEAGCGAGGLGCGAAP